MKYLSLLILLIPLVAKSQLDVIDFQSPSVTPASISFDDGSYRFTTPVSVIDGFNNTTINIEIYNLLQEEY